MPGLLDPLTELAPTAVASGPEGSRRIDLLWCLPNLGHMGMPNLWHRWWVEGTGWRPANGWYQRGGSWSSAVTATAYSGGRVDAFGRGTDGALWHTWGAAGALSRRGEWPRESLDTPEDRAIVSAPAAVALSPTYLLAAVRTRTRDTNRPGLWFASSDADNANHWRWRLRLARGWPTARRDFATAPGMGWRKPGGLDLLMVDDDYQLLHSWLDGDTTSSWGGFGQRGPEGGLTSTPSVTSWHNSNNPNLSTLHVVSCYGPFPAGPGTDPGRVELKSWLGRHWTAQKPIYTSYTTDGRMVLSPPTVTSWGKPRLDVFFLSGDDPYGTAAGITHGWNTSARQPWQWEILDLPNFT